MATDVDGSITGLAQALSATPGEVDLLAALDEDTRQRLHHAILDARARQERALAEAFEGALRLIPRPLRGRVRKLLMGGT